MELDGRKQTLLGVLVDAYVSRAEPVGSEYLADAGKLGVRPATIRNELAEMTEMGYLRQPHTSAGRIPSDLGYRYYVDHLLQRAGVPSLRRYFASIEHYSEGDIDQLLQQTCRILSSLTRYTSVAAPPSAAGVRIRSVHLAQMSDTSVLLVGVLESGRVVQRLVELAVPLAPAEVSRLSRGLDRLLRGSSTARIPAGDVPGELAGQRQLFLELAAALGRGLEELHGDIYLQGTSQLLEQPEFREADRVEPLIRMLEERRSAYEKLREMVAERAMTVVIGAENPHPAMRECSVIMARYRAGSRMSGWVGVLGPTRMDYPRAVSAVRLAATALGETFARMGWT